VEVEAGVAEAAEVGTAPEVVGTGVTVGTGVCKITSMGTAFVARF